jgi:ribosome-binding factor A
MNAQRKTRVEHALRDTLTELKDPRVQGAFITLTRVEVNVDGSVARVYVSVVGGKDPDGVIAGLAKAAGFLRGPVGRRLNLQRPPELRFVHDVSIDVGAQLAAIVRDDEERARAAGREPEPRAVAAPPAKPPAEGES